MSLTAEMSDVLTGTNVLAHLDHVQAFALRPPFTHIYQPTGQDWLVTTMLIHIITIITHKANQLT